jgi:hypothetical protein
MTRKKAGRKPLDAADPSVGICVKVPSKEYAALLRRAAARRRTVPEHIRRVLTGRKFLDI